MHLNLIADLLDEMSDRWAKSADDLKGVEFHARVLGLVELIRKENGYYLCLDCAHQRRSHMADKYGANCAYCSCEKFKAEKLKTVVGA